MWIWSGLRVMKNYRTFFHVPITYIPLSSSLMKYLTLVTRGGWHLTCKMYWLVSVGLEYKSVDSTPSDKELEVSRKETLSEKQLQNHSWALDIRRKKFQTVQCLSWVFPWLPSNILRNLLVREEMSKPNTTVGKSHSCGDKRCKCC
jgi:hypothetical protein